MGLLGPLLGLLGIVCDLLSGLRKLLCGIGLLCRLEYLSGFLIHLSLQACVVGFLLEGFHRLGPLGVLLLEFPIAILGFLGKLAGNLFATSCHVLGLSNLLISHQRLGGLCFGQLSLPLLVLFEVVLIDELIEVWIHRAELLLCLLHFFHELIGFLLDRFLRSVWIGALRLPCRSEQ